MIESGLVQQFCRPGNRAIGMTAIGRHDIRFQRIQEQRDIRDVIGQRRHGKRIIGEGDQANLTSGALMQDRSDLRACLQQA